MRRGPAPRTDTLVLAGIARHCHERRRALDLSALAARRPCLVRCALREPAEREHVGPGDFAALWRIEDYSRQRHRDLCRAIRTAFEVDDARCRRTDAAAGALGAGACCVVRRAPARPSHHRAAFVAPKTPHAAATRRAPHGGRERWRVLHWHRSRTPLVTRRSASARRAPTATEGVQAPANASFRARHQGRLAAGPMVHARAPSTARATDRGIIAVSS